MHFDDLLLNNLSIHAYLIYTILREFWHEQITVLWAPHATQAIEHFKLLGNNRYANEFDSAVY